jgi:aromatic ring hydroxylase
MEKEFPQRSSAQNRAGHKWFRELSEALNEVGFEQKITFGTVDCPWTEQAVKAMYNKIANAMYSKCSSELNTKEFSDVSEVLNRIVAEKGLHIPFPSLEEIIRRQEEEDEIRRKHKEWKDNLPKKEKESFIKAFE